MKAKEIAAALKEKHPEVAAEFEKLGDAEHGDVLKAASEHPEAVKQLATLQGEKRGAVLHRELARMGAEHGLNPASVGTLALMLPSLVAPDKIKVNLDGSGSVSGLDKDFWTSLKTGHPVIFVAGGAGSSAVVAAPPAAAVVPPAAAPPAAAQAAGQQHFGWAPQPIPPMGAAGSGRRAEVDQKDLLGAGSAAFAMLK